MKSRYLETGQIVGTHGLKGEVRVYPWCDSPDFLLGFKKLYLDKDGTVINIKSSRVHSNIVLMKIEGVDTIEQAEKLRNKILFIDRNDVKLGKDTYFIQDLIGCKVYHVDNNEFLGEISDVSKTGANDVWHITKDGAVYLIPVIDEVVISVDLDREIIKIKPIKGIFDHEN